MNTETTIELNAPVALAILALRSGGTLTIKGLEEYANEDIKMEVEHNGDTLTIRATITTEPAWLYLPPFGAPIRWTDQPKSVQHAVTNYLQHRIKGTPITEHDLDLTKTYIRYYVYAPAFRFSINAKALEQLWEAAGAARTEDDLEHLDTLCQQTGLQPIN